MAEKRKRSQNFTFEEKDKLIKIISMYKDTLLNKKTDGTTNDAKAKAWISVTARFNSSATNHRSKDSLQRVWEKLKTEAKLYKSSLRESMNKTGGGPCVAKIDPILEQVCSIMGRACTGILSVNDSDADLPILLSVNDIENPSQLDITNSTQQVTNASEVVIQETDSTLNEVIEQPCHNDYGIITGSNENDIQVTEIVVPVTPNSTPIWSRRRRPVIQHNNQRNELANTLCSSYGDLNQKRLSVEELKKQVLTEEIEFKRKLYQIQLETAEKDLEIKKEVLMQIKDGRLALQSLQGLQPSRQHYN